MPVPTSNNDVHIGSDNQVVASILSAAGDMTVGDDIVVTDDASVGGDLAVTGNTVLTGNLGVTGNVTEGVGLTITREITFTETSATSYSGVIALPAGSRIIDIGVDGQALWSATTAASIVVGDGSSATGFFVATDLKATDLLAGEINNIEHPGGKAGAYIASEQRNLYSASARNVVATVTKGGAGTSGRTRVYVTYSVPITAAGA